MSLKASPRLILGGLVTYSAAALGVFVYLRKNAPGGPADAAGGGGGGDDASVFDSIAETYDKKINWDENLMGVKLLRRWLVRQAQVCAEGSSSGPSWHTSLSGALTLPRCRGAGRRSGDQRRYRPQPRLL